MNFKKVVLILCVIFSLLPINKILAQTASAGFIPGNIWYSEDPFAEGDTITIYTLIFNPDTRQFSGTVDFFDNNVVLGKKDFVVSATSTKDVSISWTVTAGNHQIYGQIENAKFLVSNGTYVNASITDNKTSTSSRTVTNKVVTQSITNSINSANGTFEAALNSIKNIGQSITKVIPPIILNGAVLGSNDIKEFRQNTGTALETNKENAQNELDAISKTKTASLNSDIINTNSVQEPFDYIKLFTFTILHFIFEYKIVFYGLSAVLVFFILRYFWNLFFP